MRAYLLCNRSNFAQDWAWAELRAWIPAQARVLYLPLAFRDAKVFDAASWEAEYGWAGEKGQNNLAAYARYGIGAGQVEAANVFTEDAETIRRKIKGATLLHLPGGLPDRLMERLDAYGLREAVCGFEGLILGASAGAMVLFREYHITPDEDYAAFGYYEGLGLLDGFGLEVHFVNSPAQQASLARVCQERGRPVYALEDAAALVVDANGGLYPLGAVRRFR